MNTPVAGRARMLTVAGSASTLTVVFLEQRDKMNTPVTSNAQMLTVALSQPLRDKISTPVTGSVPIAGSAPMLTVAGSAPMLTVAGSALTLTVVFLEHVHLFYSSQKL